MQNNDFKNKIEEIKKILITDYCNQKGIGLKGNGRWLRLENHDSLVIDTINNSFIWNSKIDVHGDIINFVEAYYKVDFKTAIEELSGQSIKTLVSEYENSSKITNTKSNDSNKSPTPIKFELDEIDDSYSRMYAYLIQNRGISKKTVDEFAYKKLISQDKKGNINFKFKDENGNIGFVKKGTGSSFFEYIDPEFDIRGFRYTRNKNPEKIERLAIYEAPVDLMSYIDMFGVNSKTVYNAICGLKYNSVLSNIKDFPNLKELCLCVDNDSAGRKFIDKIKTLAKTEPELQNIKILAVIPEHQKDWNDMLKNKNANLPNNTIMVSDVTPKEIDISNLQPKEPEPSPGIKQSVAAAEATKKINSSLSKLSKNIRNIEKNKYNYSR